MPPAYLIKKHDTYYFRHYIPSDNQKALGGKKEFIKTLKVSKKSDAVRLSRELKIVFDLIMTKSAKNPAITWQQIRQAVDQAFDIIYQRFVKSVETHGPNFNDEYDPLKFIPPDYSQYIALNDSTVDWNSVPELRELADKIIQWKNLEISKDSNEYNLFCYRAAQMLNEHEHKKEIFRRNPDCSTQEQPHITNQEDNNKAADDTLFQDFFDTFWEETERAWKPNVKKEYVGVSKNIFRLIEAVTDKKIENIYLYDLTQDTINDFFSNLLIMPSQFTKRFEGKMSMKDALAYSKKIKDGEKIENLDEKTLKHLQQTNSAETLNGKYINLMNQFLKYAYRCGKIERNYLEERRVRSSTYAGRVRKSFLYDEIEKIFSHEIFVDKLIKEQKNQYGGAIAYFKYWVPVLALYSGARITEIAQLRLIDIGEEDNIPYVMVRPSDETTIKNKHSERNIPLHPEVIQLGFLDYVEWLKKENQRYLFPELANRERKGTVISKWFSEKHLKKDCGMINDKKTISLSFHSFRHTVTDEFKQKSADELSSARILGHKHPNITYGRYGSDLSIEKKNDTIIKYITYEGVKFPWRDNPDYFEMKKFPWNK